MNARRHVAVLMGGWSSEREISLISGGACAAALAELGHRVTPIDMTRDIGALVTALAADRPDAVFNALHGCYGEDGAVQGLLELLNVPYTHSGLLASALAMHKPTALRLFRQEGMDVPAGRNLSFGELAREAQPMPYPYVVKPAQDGSSVRVFIVHGPADVPEYDPAWAAEEALVEEYIPGLELTVAVMGDRPLAVTELRPKAGFYDYTAKYTDGQTQHFCPARISPALTGRCLDHALRAHTVLGCRGVSRSDFRYDPASDRLVTLELNTQPGMTPLSLVPEQAVSCGISFVQLVDWILGDAKCGA